MDWWVVGRGFLLVGAYAFQTANHCPAASLGHACAAPWPPLVPSPSFHANAVHALHIKKVVPAAVQNYTVGEPLVTLGFGETPSQDLSQQLL